MDHQKLLELIKENPQLVKLKNIEEYIVRTSKNDFLEEQSSIESHERVEIIKTMNHLRENIQCLERDADLFVQTIIKNRDIVIQHEKSKTSRIKILSESVLAGAMTVTTTKSTMGFTTTQTTTKEADEERIDGFLEVFKNLKNSKPPLLPMMMSPEFCEKLQQTVSNHAEAQLKALVSLSNLSLESSSCEPAESTSCSADNCDDKIQELEAIMQDFETRKDELRSRSEQRIDKIRSMVDHMISVLETATFLGLRLVSNLVKFDLALCVAEEKNKQEEIFENGIERVAKTSTEIKTRNFILFETFCVKEEPNERIIDKMIDCYKDSAKQQKLPELLDKIGDK